MGDSNQFFRPGVAKSAYADNKAGFTVDPGPYEAVVVGHVEGTRMGQLQVYIPDFDGGQSQNDPIVVSYASPFYGKTYGTDDQDQSVGAFTSGQSYGMWFVPPDVGNRVLVTFAAGDRNRGYWFACIYDSPSHHMVPGLARNIGGQASTQIDPSQSGPLASLATNSSVLPVVEFSTEDATSFSGTGITTTPRYAHPYQSMVLVSQGLDRDPIRGAISSSSLREAPSSVFGISTPGGSITGSTEQVTGGTAVDPTQAVIGRKGGHTFVMDDGDANGTDQLIRLRTAGGHQILMNDTEHVLYIASQTGLQWMEFSADGSINVYGRSGINVRTEGVLNLQGDEAVLINSKGAIGINADLGINISSLTTINIGSAVSTIVASDGIASVSGMVSLNLATLGKCLVGGGVSTAITGATVGLNNPGLSAKPKPVVPTLGNSLPDVTLNGQVWEYGPGSQRSICTVAPSHEPWIDPTTGTRPAPASGGSILSGIAVGVVSGLATGAVASSVSSVAAGAT